MTTSLFDLTGEVAAVIGGTGTLGSAMARALSAQGAAVAIVGRNAQRGEACAGQCREIGNRASFFRANAMEFDSLVSAEDAIQQELGPTTILVNAAGGNHPAATIGPGDEFPALPLAAWRDVFDLNLVGGVLLPCQVFGAKMLHGGSGSIINIASMSGMTPLSRVVAYSAAKAAVINLTQFLAREWSTRGLRVNSISPGFFPAEQNMALLMNEDGSYTARGEQIIAHTPMQRFGDPTELSGAVVWLASNSASSFVTGQNIVVDGGFSSTTI